MNSEIDSKSYPALEMAHVENAEKPGIVDYKTEAIDAENVEHNMTVLQAVQAYPMASFWALVMSSTIVGFPPLCCDKSVAKSLD